MKNVKHIGIASITAEGGALAFREIVHISEKILGKNIHPEITLHSHPFSKYTDTIGTRSRDWADLIVASAHKLAATGADFMICPSNTNHIEFDLVADGWQVWCKAHHPLRPPRTLIRHFKRARESPLRTSCAHNSRLKIK